MEKILALIAVSLGKKFTVYAVGRVSMSDLYYTTESSAFWNLLRLKTYVNYTGAVNIHKNIACSSWKS